MMVMQNCMNLGMALNTMDWSDLRIFLAIARERTLGAAARRLGMTQPTMGRRLRALETAAGHALFQRTAAGFVLTDEGATVFDHAERIEQEALAIQRRLAGRATQLEGPLRLTSSDWFGTHVLAPVLADFAVRHPQVGIELLTDARFLSLSRREADLAFRIRTFTEPDVVSRKLMHVRYAVYQRSGLPPPRRGDGSHCTLLALDAAFAGTPDDSWLSRALPRARIGLRSNSRDVQARLCAHGAGLAVLPVVLGERIGELERVDLGGEPPGRDTWIGYHRDLRRLPRLRAMVEFLVERLANADLAA
ncbi:MAG TPA: LysR family transcriptional regulator [Tahibacter sp.]|uniref:LysR family transcriptional regulator n=1 Tax=Tahibacter sp. TaxID=2056211 RepID=UPI002CACD42E|nr:LysR family transcriptional regulator [Tahibacter sp.]HSX59902.1 LysR family transcriptional regulator [Tahibacter sp.]